MPDDPNSDIAGNEEGGRRKAEGGTPKALGDGSALRSPTSGSEIPRSELRGPSLDEMSMMELFRVEVENQTAVLTGALLELEKGNASAGQLESLMRAAHSLKGGARIVNLPQAVRVAHAMEDCFVEAQKGALKLTREGIDTMLRGVDLLGQLAHLDAEAATALNPKVEEFLASLAAFKSGKPQTGSNKAKGEAGKPDGGDQKTEIVSPSSSLPLPSSAVATTSAQAQPPAIKPESQDRVLRLTAENLNRLLGLAGESLVESRWLRPFTESMQRLKRMHTDMEDALDGFRLSLREDQLSEQSQARLEAVFHRATESRHYLGERLQELDLFDRRSAHLSNRLYLEVLRARMRPFGDGVRQFPRMVRDLARSLGKQVRFEVLGENTQVDRDILDRLEVPLAHLLRNAIDHGCEPAQERVAAGKRPEATIRLEARHSAGALVITISDDGPGVDIERVRRAVVAKGLASPVIAERLTDSELLEFLFLPGFTMKDTVTEISGRGVGLDIVQNLARSVRGGVRVATETGRGTRFQLQLPLTLSVVRTLLVDVGGEPYAFPLTQITNAVKLPSDKIEALEGRPHFRHRDRQIGLLSAHQVLDRDATQFNDRDLPIVVLGDRGSHYGLVVDRFLGERELVVQPLDPRLGKVKDVSAAALMEDGSPVLIVDVADMVRSIEKLVSEGVLTGVRREALAPVKKKKRVLAVDDSLTVRELERKLLANHGYEAEVAVDGMDGWNAVRHGDYDLVITDVDMPRMDGIELTTLIKKDPNLKATPVLIVTYKDREEDRMRGLQAGADYYLTKGSFHDETLIKAVVDLIGEPDV
jgi:two-component system, chemotaxis family, sensor histidine kinase and response regulator WspE